MSLSYSALSVVPSDYFPSMPQPTQLGYSSNNLYENFPPIMSDGRAVIASYQPEAVTNQELIKESGIQTNWEYRKYLQTNAKKIMQQNCTSMANDVGYVRRYQIEKVENVPYSFTSMEQRTPANLQGYNDSDLKRMYLTREQLNSRTNAATEPVTQQEVLKFR